MADYFQRFLTPEIPVFIGQILDVREEAAARGFPRVALDLDTLVRDIAEQMEKVAVETAAWTEERAKALLEQRTKRPDSDSSPHLRDVISAEVIRGPIGEFGLGNLEELGRARRRGRRSDGAYWRANELGLSEGFVGRRLHGVFTPSESAPGPFDDDTGFRVTGEHGDGGWMTIRHPIEGKHFLGDAAKQGAVRYQREVRKIKARADKRLLAIAARIPPAGPPGAARRRGVAEDIARGRRRRL